MVFNLLILIVLALLLVAAFYAYAKTGKFRNLFTAEESHPLRTEQDMLYYAEHLRDAAARLRRAETSPEEKGQANDMIETAAKLKAGAEALHQHAARGEVPLTLPHPVTPLVNALMVYAMKWHQRLQEVEQDPQALPYDLQTLKDELYTLVFVADLLRNGSASTKHP